MKALTLKIFLYCTAFLCSCKLIPEADPDESEPGRDTILSRFERAGYTDLLIDKSGTYHAVFLESPDISKPIFVYYTYSSNKGKSWSDPVAVSNDGTGNGSGYARLIQDGSGTIYALWKRFGDTQRAYPVPQVTIEGVAGYGVGTLFFAVLNGTAFSKPYMLAEDQAMQVSWFPAVDPQGKLQVIWSQITPLSKQNGWASNHQADWLRGITLSGTSATHPVSYTTPALPPANNPNGRPTEAGIKNLRGYIDASGGLRMVFEIKLDGVENLVYFDGKQYYEAYQYPKYQAFNTFDNPATLLRDERGNDHIIFLPPANTLESEQIWDFDVSAQKTNILASVKKQGIKIQGFQAHQGPGGEMAVTVQAGGLAESNETYGLFYKNGRWTTAGLSKNSSRDTFSYAEFKNFSGYNSYLTTLGIYTTQFTTVAWDGSAKKKMLMTLSADLMGSGYRTSSPSVMYSDID